MIGKSFIFELAEPGDALKGHTRKFVTYFSHEVTLQLTESGVHFTPYSEFTRYSRNYIATFSGTMQLVYAGSGVKGDFTHANAMNQYAGVYSYKPKVRFGADQEEGMGYISFDWNKRGGDFYGENPDQKLLFVALFHHVSRQTGRPGCPKKGALKHIWQKW